MSTRIYFDNLATTVTEKELMDLFSVYGNVASLHIAIDRTNHKSRGFGVVTMITPEGARSAVQFLSGKALSTGTLTLSEALPAKVVAYSKNERQSPLRKVSCLY